MTEEKTTKPESKSNESRVGSLTKRLQGINRKTMAKIGGATLGIAVIGVGAYFAGTALFGNRDLIAPEESNTASSFQGPNGESNLRIEVQNVHGNQDLSDPEARKQIEETAKDLSPKTSFLDIFFRIFFFKPYKVCQAIIKY